MADDSRARLHPGDPEPPVRGRVVIDVSNVCRSREIPVKTRSGIFHEAARLRLVVAEWRHLHGADADLKFVVDHALRDDFVREQCLDQWNQLARDFDLIGQRHADGMIVDLAMTERRFVITNDRFYDFRRKLPWIERQPERFLWVQGDAGSLRFVKSGIEAAEDYKKSRAEQESEMRNLGYRGSREWRRIWLKSRWRCRNRRCRTAQSEFRQRLLVPRCGSGERPLCRECDGPVDEVGRRGAWREVKVMNAERTEEWGRFVLDTGPSIEIGRGRADYGVSLDTMVADDEAQGRVSRQHVKLALDPDRRLSVVDLESSNGTVLHYSTKKFAELVPHEWRAVHDNGWIVLGGKVCLALSVRTDLPSVTEPVKRSSDDRVTRL